MSKVRHNHQQQLSMSLGKLSASLSALHFKTLVQRGLAHVHKNEDGTVVTIHKAIHQCGNCARNKNQN